MRLLRNLVLVIALVVVVVEVLAHLALLALDTPLGELQILRASLLESEERGPGLVKSGLRGWNQDVVLHPYFGFAYEFQIGPDGHGLLGDDPLEAGPETFNVAIVGGSVAGNFFSDVHESLAARLAGEPVTGGRPVRVFSLSVGGWHEPQQAQAVAYFLALGASLDWVINIDGYNEASVAFSQRSTLGVSVYYPNEWSLLTDGLLDDARRKALGRLYATDLRREDWARWTATPPLGQSALIAALWSAIDGSLARSVAAEIEALRELGQRRPFQEGYRANVDLTEARARITDVWESASRFLGLLQDARGGRYLHVLQPNQYVPDSKPLTSEERRIAYRPEERHARWARSGYEALIARGPRLEQAGIAYLDATGIFRSADEDLYVDACCHLNARGHALLLEAILDFASERGQLDAVAPH